MYRHLFLDRTFHALESDAKLVFQQLTNSPHAPIAEMVDIIRLINRTLLFVDRVLAHLQDVRDDLKEVFGRQQRIVYATHLRLAHLDVEFQAAHAGKVELARIEEHAFQQAIGSLHSRRIAWTHLAIDFEQGVDWLADRVFLQSLRDDNAHVVSLRKENPKALDAAFRNLLQFRGRDFSVRFEQYFTGFSVDDVGRSVGAFELQRFDFDFTNFCLAQAFE